MKSLIRVVVAVGMGALASFGAGAASALGGPGVGAAQGSLESIESALGAATPEAMAAGAMKGQFALTGEQPVVLVQAPAARAAAVAPAVPAFKADIEDPGKAAGEVPAPASKDKGSGDSKLWTAINVLGLIGGFTGWGALIGWLAFGNPAGGAIIGTVAIVGFIALVLLNEQVKG